MNQASLAFNTSLAAGINYQSRFNLKELSTCTAGFIMPVNSTSVGAIYSHFGYSDFRRSMTGLACGLNLANNIAAGIQVDYFAERTYGEYNDRNTLTFEIGTIISITENLQAGIHLFNPLPNAWRKEYMPSTISVGTGIRISPSLFAALEADINSDERFVAKTGFEYKAVKNFILRGGYNTDHNSFSFGLSYWMKPVKIDLAFATHDRLGISSSVAMLFIFNRLK